MTMTSVPMQYATTSDGVRIAYISLGDGPPFVFASNIFGDASAYCAGSPHTREVTDRLVRLGSRVIRYDHRGMGGSDRDVEDLSLEGRVRDLAAVVGHLGLRRFALGGVSVGTATAIAYAVENHAAVSRLVLLSPWASGARSLQIPELRAAYSAAATGEREWKVFANILASVVRSSGSHGGGSTKPARNSASSARSVFVGSGPSVAAVASGRPRAGISRTEGVAASRLPAAGSDERAGAARPVWILPNHFRMTAG